MLTIPPIVTILAIAIAGIGSGSFPAIAAAIVTIEPIIWTRASDRERSERSSYSPRCTAVEIHFMLILISSRKKVLEAFCPIGMIEWTWVGDRRDELRMDDHSDLK